MQLSYIQANKGIKRHLLWFAAAIANIKKTVGWYDYRFCDGSAKILGIRPSVWHNLYDGESIIKKKALYILHQKSESMLIVATANLFMRHIWSKHGLPISLTSDRKLQFVLKMWDLLYTLLGIKIKLSITYYFETNGQSKIVNQKAKQYLRTYTNHFQRLSSVIINGKICCQC